MAHPVIIRTVVAAATAMAGLAFSATAQAETVSYDFTANVTNIPSYSALNSEFDVGDQLTGSLSYDDAAKIWSSDVDPTLQIDQITVNGGVELRYTFSFADWELHPVFSGETPSPYPEGSWLSGDWQVRLFFPNVSVEDDWTLPSSLDASGAHLEVSYSGWTKLSANVTSMTTRSSVPELDPVSGAGALALLAGGIAMMYGRRRRQVLAA